MHSTYGDDMDIDDFMMPAFATTMPRIDNGQANNNQQGVPDKDVSALTNTSSSDNKQLTQSRTNNNNNNNNSLSLFPSSLGLGLGLGHGQSLMSMSVDIHAEPDKYLVSCELPGVDKSSIDISADKRTNTLSIKAEKRHEFTQTGPSEENNKKENNNDIKKDNKDKQGDVASPSATTTGAKSDANKPQQTNNTNNTNNKSSPRIIRQERSYGMVQRSFRLSKDADLDNIQAKFDNGVLKLNVPRVKKAENEETKKITIQ